MNIKTNNFIKVADIKRQGANAISRKEPNFLISRNKVISAVVPIDQYEKMLEIIEDYYDLLVVQERKGGPFMGFNDLLRELDLKKAEIRSSGSQNSSKGNKASRSEDSEESTVKD